MNEFHNDVFEEIAETGGVKRVVFMTSGAFALSPASTEAVLYVFIDVETDKPTYMLEFTHVEHNGVLPVTCVDRTERFTRLDDAVCRFTDVTSIIGNIIMRQKLAKGEVIA